jgi:hypothetical protein
VELFIWKYFTVSPLQNFKLLLASTDPEILIATLETLSALVKINPSKLHGGGKLIGCGSVNSYLLCLHRGGEARRRAWYPSHQGLEFELACFLSFLVGFVRFWSIGYLGIVVGFCCCLEWAMLRRSIFSGFHPGKMLLHGIVVIKILQ